MSDIDVDDGFTLHEYCRIGDCSRLSNYYILCLTKIREGIQKKKKNTNNKLVGFKFRFVFLPKR